MTFFLTQYTKLRTILQRKADRRHNLFNICLLSIFFQQRISLSLLEGDHLERLQIPCPTYIPQTIVICHGTKASKERRLCPQFDSFIFSFSTSRRRSYWASVCNINRCFDLYRLQSRFGHAVSRGRLTAYLDLSLVFPC